MIKSTLTPQQKENSARFCEDFVLREQMRAEFQDDSYEQNDFSCVEKLSAPRAWDSDIKVGDVRVLSQTAETQYVVVLERRDWNYLVVPFSPFSEPATQGELKLEWEGGLYLEVVQVWNARTINFLQLAKSWFVAELPEKVMDEIWAVRANYLFGDSLPEELIARTGAPIFVFDDPRIKYQQQSMEVFAEIDRVDFELLNQAERLVDNPPKAIVFPEEEKYAAAGEKFLSRVYDASRQLPQNILKTLALGKLPGRRYSSSATLESGEGEIIWSLPWAKTARSAIFWDVRAKRLLGVGVLIPGRKTGNIYLRADLRQKPDAPICAADVVIFLGR